MEAVLAMSFQDEKGDTALCHLSTEPVFPERVNNPLLEPLQTVTEPAIVPPLETGSTVITATAELVTEQTPPCSMALYFEVVVRLEAVSVFVVLAISAIEAQSSVVFCHLRIDPVCPERVRLVAFVPAQTVADPATVPPTEIGSMVMMATEELASEQIPLRTTALKCVVCVSAPDV